MLRIVPTPDGGFTLEYFNADTITATTEQTLPAGCHIGTSMLVVDKMDVAVCDGNNNWYRSDDGAVVKAVAGQPVSALF